MRRGRPRLHRMAGQSEHHGRPPAASLGPLITSDTPSLKSAPGNRVSEVRPGISTTKRDCRARAPSWSLKLLELDVDVATAVGGGGRGVHGPRLDGGAGRMQERLTVCG